MPEPCIEHAMAKFEQALNQASKSEGISDHQFSEDRAYGELVKRFSNRTVTKEYIDLINTRLLNYGLRNEKNRITKSRYASWSRC